MEFKKHLLPRHNISHPSTKNVYLQMLNLDRLPISPDEIPGRILLPSGFIGDLEQSILATTLDGRERSQSISWKASKGYVGHKVYKGDELHTSTLDAISTLLRVFFGRKHLLSYHTHPKNGNPGFSSHDIELYLSSPRMSFISVVGSNLGILALLQTTKTAHLPISVFEAHISGLLSQEVCDVQYRLSRDKSPHLVLMPDQVRAKLLEEEGFGYYQWIPPRVVLHSGDLQDGCELRRVII